MSQYEIALSLEELRDENEELQLQIEELKLRLSQYENVETSSTRSDSVSEWNEWPYRWATGGWKNVAQRFHSIHSNLGFINLSCGNRRSTRRFQQSKNSHDVELTLL